MTEVLVTGPAGIIIDAFNNTVHLVSGATGLTSAGCNCVGNDASAGQEAVPGIISDSSTFTHATGTIHGGAGNTADDLQGSPGIASTIDVSFSMTGGTITGGAPATGALSGSPGLVCGDPTAFAASGGTCTGGAAGTSSNMQGGTGLVIAAVSQNLTISGGTWVGGAGDGTGAQGYGIGFNVQNGHTLTINGGTWTGSSPVGNIGAGSKVRVYTSPGIVPTYPDGRSFVATSGAGFIDYTAPFGRPPKPVSHRQVSRPYFSGRSRF